MAADGPFAGLTVLEFGQFVVVPFCSQFLADGGARVIKVEPLNGDPYRSADAIAPNESRQYITKNRGKQSLSLKVGAPGADEVINRLVRIADVVLINMRKETVERHGLAYEKLKLVNPQIVYGSVTGFGSKGPEAKYAGMDVVAQARSGLIMAAGAERDNLHFHSEVQIADYTAALLLLSGVSAALLARERRGHGQEVEVSLLGAGMTIQNNVLGDFAEHDGWRSEFLNEVLPRARAERWSVAEIDAARSELRPDPRNTDFYRVFQTADGSVAVGAGSPGLVKQLLETLGAGGAGEDRATQVRGIEEALEAMSSEDAIELFREEGIPVSAVFHIDELLRDPHVEAEGLVADLDHPTVGRYRALGEPIRLSADPFRANGTSPTFAADTESILGELGFSGQEIEGLVDAGSVRLRAAEPIEREPSR